MRSADAIHGSQSRGSPGSKRYSGHGRFESDRSVGDSDRSSTGASDRPQEESCAASGPGSANKSRTSSTITRGNRPRAPSQGIASPRDLVILHCCALSRRCDTEAKRPVKRRRVYRRLLPGQKGPPASVISRGDPRVCNPSPGGSSLAGRAADGNHSGMSGAPGGIRTPDPRLRRPMLYPTELQARWALTIHQRGGSSSLSYLRAGTRAPAAGAGREPEYPVWNLLAPFTLFADPLSLSAWRGSTDRFARPLPGRSSWSLARTLPARTITTHRIASLPEWRRYSRGLHPNTDLASLVGRVCRDKLRWLVVPAPALAAWERRDPSGWANVLKWLETKGVTIVPV